VLLRVLGKTPRFAPKCIKSLTRRGKGVARLFASSQGSRNGFKIVDSMTSASTRRQCLGERRLVRQLGRALRLE
jgi:hypothetical protein